MEEIETLKKMVSKFDNDLTVLYTLCIYITEITTDETVKKLINDVVPIKMLNSLYETNPTQKEEIDNIKKLFKNKIDGTGDANGSTKNDK